MPNIRPYEKYDDAPYIAHQGINPSIGWVFCGESKGASVFALMKRSGFLGIYEVHTSFPLTEEGWAQAWQELASLSPKNAAKIEDMLRKRTARDLATGVPRSFDGLDHGS